MNAAPSATAAVSDSFARDHHSTGTKDMSFGKMSGARSPRSFEVHLRDAWVELISTHFETPEHAAAFFGVSEKTARNWATGSCGPRGGPVAYALKHMPGAARMLLGDT